MLYICNVQIHTIMITIDKNRRRLPVGIQSFKEIRTDNYVYVDKTDLVWYLANLGDKYNYLSRPRRFGKSVLVDTLQWYFEGRKDLFEGLRIMDLETEWTTRPVIRLDMSEGGDTPEDIKSYLNYIFKKYEKKYEITLDGTESLTVRFRQIIETAYEKSGHRVAILIDEYDAPLQHSWKTTYHDECTRVYKNVFAVLKSATDYEKFIFITGITKFTQISLFSVLNNLTNISFLPEYATLCGITEKELEANFSSEVKMLGEVNGWEYEEAHQRLKEYYDGYHFSRNKMTDIYNPYSLVNALKNKEISNYWAGSGATILLPKFVDDMELRMADFSHCSIMKNTIELSDVTEGGAELFLYQSGYLTLKGADGEVCFLGFPNAEVKQALYDIVLPTLTMKRTNEVKSMQANLYTYMNHADLEKGMQTLKALIADVPYSNKKMKSMNMEERYRLVISTIFNAIGFNVEVERMLSTGRIDAIVTTPKFIYVLELKLTNNGGVDAAAQQIIDNRYLEPFKADKRKVIGLAIELDEQGKGLIDWKRVK